jgi:hypothetical protein
MRYADTVGFKEIGWLIQQLPRDLHMFQTMTHGGRSDAFMRATTNSNGVVCRCEQAIHGDGRFVGVPHSQRANERHTVEFRGPATFTVLDLRNRMKYEASTGGGHWQIEPRPFWGTVLIGRKS